MTLDELLAFFVSVARLANGVAFGLRYGCFAAAGVGLAAWLLGLASGILVTLSWEELDRNCARLAQRRPRPGGALRWLAGLGFLVLPGLILVGPMVLLGMTRLRGA